jgi:hypothetical protein
MTIGTPFPSLPLTSRTLLGDAGGSPLPIEGWRLYHRRQSNGRRVIEINDVAGDLVGLITSTNLPMLSVDAAWRGRSELVDDTRQWWALAFGHASAGDDDPAVTFSRRLGPSRHIRRTVVRPSRVHGLWVAAVPGLYSSVTCRQGTEHRIRRLAAVPRLQVHD